MKKRVLIIIIILSAVVLFIASWKILIPFAKYAFRSLSPYDETAEIYKQTWQSKDGKICFTASDKKQMIWDNVYEGTYSHNNSVVQIEILIGEGSSKARITTKYSFEPLNYIYEGNGKYDILSEEYVVQVEGADAEFSDYKAGDVIVFQKVNSTE